MVGAGGEGVPVDDVVMKWWAEYEAQGRGEGGGVRIFDG
jgi:hypothetical protein